MTLNDKVRILDTLTDEMEKASYSFAKIDWNSPEREIEKQLNVRYLSEKVEYIDFILDTLKAQEETILKTEWTDAVNSFLSKFKVFLNKEQKDTTIVSRCLSNLNLVMRY
jgi:hypothetical protein